MKVTFRTLSIADANLFHAWLNDYEVIRYSQSRFLKKQTKSEVKTWLSKIIQGSDNYTTGIVDIGSNKLIGYAGIADISKPNNSGEYFILIGDKDYWSKGYGTEVTRHIIDYGFKTLKLHRIQLTVSVPNIGGIIAYERAVLKKEGVLREACFRDGKYHDIIVMSILEVEWSKQFQLTPPYGANKLDQKKTAGC